MPQLRKDPIVSRWVIIATERARRGAAFIDPVSHDTDPIDCPFCHSKDTAPIYTKDGVRVLHSGTPYFAGHAGPDFKIQRHGLYEESQSFGSHEVVVETPQHIANMADLSVEQIKAVFETYAVRMKHHQQDPAIKSVIAYKNHGLAAGSRSIGHARSQIMAVPVLPARVKDKLNGAKLYFDFHERSLFYDLVRQEIKEGDRIVHETKNFLAFCPFAARFPFEIWVVPKQPHADFTVGVQGLELELAGMMKVLLSKYKVGLNDPAYNYMLQSGPSVGGSEELYSWHIELLPRLTRVAGFERGTGFYINPLPPEMTAKFLREVKV